MFRLKRLYFSFGLFVIIVLLCLLIQNNTVTQTVSFSDKPIGFCMLDGTTTGGGDTEPTTVSSFSELKSAVQGDSPRVVLVFSCNHIYGNTKYRNILLKSGTINIFERSCE